MNFETAKQKGLYELIKNSPKEVGPGQGTRTDIKPSDNIRKLSKKGGTSSHYLAARIKRDRPDIAAAVERGEFSSMRSAAIPQQRPRQTAAHALNVTACYLKVRHLEKLIREARRRVSGLSVKTLPPGRKPNEIIITKR